MSSDELSLDSENYYEILECERTATGEQIKQNYQRLLRTLHPDKRSDRNINDSEKQTEVKVASDERFLALQRAWATLKDPQLRRRYDAALACHELTDILLYETLDLSELEHISGECVFTYACRCGGCYILSEDDVALPEVSVGCNECSFSILVRNSKRCK